MAYTGQTRDPKLIKILKEFGIGECTVRGELKSRKRDPWFYDNGAYRDWQASKDFDGVRYSRDCRRMRMDTEFHGMMPDFVVLPDLVAAGTASLNFSEEYLFDSVLPDSEHNFPLYLAVQNGMTEADVFDWIDRVRDEHGAIIRGLFVGGTTPWKIETGRAWVRCAHEHDLKCHIGRVGVPDRISWARSIGADSIDSCLPIMFPKEHLAPFLAAVA